MKNYYLLQLFNSTRSSNIRHVPRLICNSSAYRPAITYCQRYKSDHLDYEAPVKFSASKAAVDPDEVKHHRFSMDGDKNTKSIYEIASIMSSLIALIVYVLRRERNDLDDKLDKMLCLDEIFPEGSNPK